MTRINLGVDPRLLSRQHLLAEHREMKRIPNMVSSGSVKLTHDVTEFRLGTGHVKFFYDKLMYLLRRYKRVHAECVNRGYVVADYSLAWDSVPRHLMKDYQPTIADRDIVIERLISKDPGYVCVKWQDSQIV